MASVRSVSTLGEQGEEWEREGSVKGELYSEREGCVGWEMRNRSEEDVCRIWREGEWTLRRGCLPAWYEGLSGI